jgi:hypothetical protein
MKKTVPVLTLALAASVATGLLGLWPDLHGSGESTADRHEKVRIASAANDYIKTGWEISRVRLNYLPHRALILAEYSSGGRPECAVVAQNFGDRLDHGDVAKAPCDF